MKCEVKPFASYPFNFRLFEKYRDYCGRNGSAMFTYILQIPKIVSGSQLKPDKHLMNYLNEKVLNYLYLT